MQRSWGRTEPGVEEVNEGGIVAAAEGDGCHGGSGQMGAANSVLTGASGISGILGRVRGTRMQASDC